MGNNIDYEIIWDATTLEQLIAENAIGAGELASHAATDTHVASGRELVLSILRFIASGSGGERRVDSLQIITWFARRFHYRIALGGTSVRAALAMRVLGYTSMVHLVTLNDQVQTLLPPDCQWVCSNPPNRVYPHLIVQFPAGARLRVGSTSIRAPQANRIIYVHDPENAAMRLSPKLGKFIDRARVVLLSGFNAMQSAAELCERLAHLERALASRRGQALVVFEDAGYHKPGHGALVREKVSRFVDVHSMNEDELAGHVGRNVDLLDAEEVADALEQLQSLSSVPVLIVHTRHWALAWARDAQWQQATRYAGALESGMALAATRLRLGDSFTRRDVETTGRLARQPDSERFAAALAARAGKRVCCIAAHRIDIDNEVTTVGLGDAFVGGLLSRLLEAGRENTSSRRAIL